MEDFPNQSEIITGFVAVMGRPNVGKSTLINALLGQKIAAVSSRPQTTRKRQMGILTIPLGALPPEVLEELGHTTGTEDDPRQSKVMRVDDTGAQIIFVDTPGVHKPRHKLGELMNQEAAHTIEESDAVLFVVDATEPPTDEDGLLFDLINGMRRRRPVILALNKQDATSQEVFAENRRQFEAGLLQAQAIPVSARYGNGLPELVQALLKLLPTGVPYFPTDQLTDLYERDIAADLIREAALQLLRDEVPHGIAIRIDQFTERGDEGAYIEATLFVERESHKGIVIGQGGGMLKKIGSVARQEIERMSGRKVFLQLKVKVRKNWRDDDKTLKSFGY